MKITVHHIIGGESIIYAIASTATLIVSVITLRNISVKFRSLALRAEIRHLRVDVVETLMVLYGVTLAVTANPIYDMIGAMAVMALMLYGVFENLVEVSEALSYKVPSEGLVRKVEHLTLKVKGVKGCHSIRMRKLGNKLFLDLHVIVDDDIPVKEAHEIVHEVEDLLRREVKDLVDVVVHVEPLSSESTPQV